MSALFPFSAVVGHDDLRLALLLNAVHPRIGGVLVRGEKGTAKSTVVRALAALLPSVTVAEDCRFVCDPALPDPRCPDAPHDGGPGERRPARLVELPVGATEDRLVGSLDLERALTEGVRAYQPGLLAAAHRGVLYVDEVNLLHDHLVDLLLDAAGMGRAHVEREGVSVSHAASFLLVGTMNPEEGELRPQLLDRFGLTVEVKAARDVDTRTEVIRRRLAFEDDPETFAARWSDADAELAARIDAARAALADVVLPDAELRRIAAVCAAFEVDGMRADLVLARTAVAHAAWRGARAVEETDVAVAARLALPHRRRRDPFDEPGLDSEQLDQALSDAAEHADRPDPADAPPADAPPAEQRPEGPDDDLDPPDGPDDGPDGPDGPDTPDGPDDGPGGPSGPGGLAAPEQSAADTDAASNPDSRAPERPPAAPAPVFRTRLLRVPGVGQGAPGRRSRARAQGGRVVRPSTVEGSGMHLVGTVTAAAPQQVARGRRGPGLVLRAGDLRRSVREGREGNLVLFVVDASGSMAARQRMSAVTGAVLSLLLDAYQRRDKVGLITVRGRESELTLPPTSSVDAAAARLRGLRTGGRTPLADGLLRAAHTLHVERLRDPRRRPLLVLVTDGRATTGLPGSADPVADSLRAAGMLAAQGVASVVVDCESGPVRLGLADRLAAALSGDCLQLAELSAEQVAGVVRTARGDRRAA